MDKAGIFTDLTRRNALRREAKLPLLDLQIEFQLECAAVARREYEAKCAEHGAERERIEREVFAEYTARTGTQPGDMVRRYLNWKVRKRLDDYMRSIGITPVPFPPARNAIVYGERGARSDRK